MSAGLSLQKFIFDNLGALPFPVYDDVPENAAFPYAVFSSATSAQIDDTCTRRWLVSVTLQVWSRYNGWAEAEGMMSQIDLALAWTTGTVNGYYIVKLAPETATTFRDADAFTRRGVMTFSATVVKV